MVLLEIYSDKYRKKIKTAKCDEPLVNVTKYFKGLPIKKQKKNDKRTYLLRKTVADMLIKASLSLPKGYKLFMSDGYRPLSLQRKYFIEQCKKVKKKHPEWTEKKIKKEAGKYVGDPNLAPPHSTGGAVDVTVIDNMGKRLNMGSGFGELNHKSYTYYKGISKKAKKNREILIKAMKKTGFVNYIHEWWHWSYGDKYWATVKKKDAIYESKDIKRSSFV